MTALFKDIREDDEQQMNKQRVKGTQYDQVVNADDTICIPQTLAAMNRLLAAIEIEGQKYGLKLNKTKCEYIPYGTTQSEIRIRRTSTASQRSHLSRMSNKQQRRPQHRNNQKNINMQHHLKQIAHALETQ